MHCLCPVLGALTLISHRFSCCTSFRISLCICSQVELLLGSHQEKENQDEDEVGVTSRPRLREGVKDALIVGEFKAFMFTKCHFDENQPGGVLTLKFLESVGLFTPRPKSEIRMHIGVIPDKEFRCCLSSLGWHTCKSNLFFGTAIRMGHEGVVRALLRHFDGLDLKSALLAAAMVGNEAIMTSLLTHVQSDLLQFS